MSIVPNSGRVAIAESIALRPLHHAWGRGNGSWTEPPSEPLSGTALIDEVGRRTASEVAFVLADPAGDIVLPTGRFARSPTPTSNLLISTQFDFGDAPSDVIRELAIFVGSTTDPALPAGQAYFLPGQVVTPGRLLHLEYRVPIFRSPTNTAKFETVIQF